MSLMQNTKTWDNCPNCGHDLHSAPEGENTDFCQKCRFPLMVVANKYRLVNKFTEGGFAILYSAEHIHLERDARRVIKVIKPEYLSNENMRTRFVREVQVTSALSQRNNHIVRIYDDFGEIANLGYFYVMEYLEGQPLNEMLDQVNGLLPLELCYHLFLQLCDAMREAHKASIVHRDLKPHNIFIIEQGRDSHFLKVIDFGIAKPVGNQADQAQVTQGILGTPAYMSPEQCVNRNVSARSDIYAMGIILYELLSGETPFVPRDPMKQEDLSVMEIMTAHLNTKPPPVQSNAPPHRNIPWSMEAVIQRALAKRPGERFASVEEMEQAFLQALPESQQPGNYLTGLHKVPDLTPRTPPPVSSYPSNPEDAGETVLEMPRMTDIPAPLPPPPQPDSSSIADLAQFNLADDRLPSMFVTHEPNQNVPQEAKQTAAYGYFEDHGETEIAVETVSAMMERNASLRDEVNLGAMPPGHFPSSPPQSSLHAPTHTPIPSPGPRRPIASPNPTPRDFRRKVIEIDRRQEPQRNIPLSTPHPMASPFYSNDSSGSVSNQPSQSPSGQRSQPWVERNPVPAVQRASESMLPTPSPHHSSTGDHPSFSGVSQGPRQPRTSMRSALKQPARPKSQVIKLLVFIILMTGFGILAFATKDKWLPLLLNNKRKTSNTNNSMDLPAPPRAQGRHIPRSTKANTNKTKPNANNNDSDEDDKDEDDVF